ncbi:recombinase family protein [Mucilaginibacter sp.]|uniref:recombinase family protein n=1 Tax=Mucilaginibacter sp. TaxID=1882438 RepID=UPI000CAD9021|nr:recombinase family protein [Mucilaginibacter sp.]PLW91311.1 MAG: hypothetical protein C0154_01840 [Mucilaginibacter sp.]
MNALGYLRLSSKDQSKSLEYQESSIKEYCKRNKLNMLGVFKDNGESSYTFDRPDYMALEAYLKKYKGECQYLIVLDHDRFSRNLPEALMKIAELEKKYGVKVLSTNERIDLDTSDPDVFMKRALDYMMANKELFNIRHRTKQGIRNAKEKGRYLGRAPFGYQNIIDGSKTNLIGINQSQAVIVRKIFNDYLLGIAPYIIYKDVKALGFKNTGNSAIYDVLNNPLYAGFIKVAAYRDLPEKLVKGLHEPIISETEYWAAQKMLSNKRPQRIQPAEDFPLRGVLKCWCGRNYTAGWSKGKKQYYMYYKCIDHNYINIPGPKLHDQFNEVLKALAFKPHQIKDLVTKAKAMLVEPLKLKQEKTKENAKALHAVNEKIYLLEKRYMENEIEGSTYKTWFKQYKEEKAELEMALSGRAKMKDSNEAVFERVLPWMSNLFGIYDKCTIYQKHSIVRGVFKDNLAYSEGAFRTPFIDPTFEDNSLILKEKGLLFLEYRT